ncbi:transketolase [Lipomyces tetrasporus]
MYDNNQITCDGSVDLTNTENIDDKMRACGWNVIEVEDGYYDIAAIICAMKAARESNDKPTFINIHTIIGVGSKIEGDARAHGSAFGESEVRNIKIANAMDPDRRFYVPSEVYSFFADIISRGDELVTEYNALLASYCAAYPEVAAEFEMRRRGELRSDWKSFIPALFPNTPTATRKSAGLVFDPVAANCNSFMVGTAGLSPSVNMIWPGKVDFQHPELKTDCGIVGNYGDAISIGECVSSPWPANGIAAFNPGTIIPVTSCFFMFFIYAAPAVRMGSLMGLQVIHVATHDSIGTGEDGPTHQPIALPALYRAMPNMLYIRPCDSEETAGAWTVAIESKHTPSILSLSRQNLRQFSGLSSRENVRNGAYVLEENADAIVTIIGSLASMGVQARIVSFPCQRLFEKQSREYKRSVLKRSELPVVVVEALHQPGGKEAYKYFGFAGNSIARRIANYLQDCKIDSNLKYEFQEL